MKKYLILLLAIIVITCSCQKERVLPETPTPTISEEQNSDINGYWILYNTKTETSEYTYTFDEGIWYEYTFTDSTVEHSHYADSSIVYYKTGNWNWVVKNKSIHIEKSISHMGDDLDVIKLSPDTLILYSNDITYTYIR